MLAGANIPFNATNNSQVRQFLLDHTRNGGAILKAAGLLLYLSDVYQSNLEKKVIDALLVFETNISFGIFIHDIMQS